jgi:hypothetical protein
MGLLSLIFFQVNVFAQTDCSRYDGPDYDSCNSAKRCQIVGENARGDVESSNSKAQKVATGLATANQAGVQLPRKELKQFMDENGEKYGCVSKLIKRCIEECRGLASDEAAHQANLRDLESSMDELKRGSETYEKMGKTIEQMLSEP